MYRRWLAIYLIALVAFASGCIADDFPSNENKHLADDVSDAGVTGDAGETGDAGDASDTGDDATDASQPPQTCADGFYDIDDDVDGCEYECDFQSDDDTPDADGIDQNCDGVDGSVDDSVFVSEDGDDENHDGLGPDRPVGTLSNALAIAAAEQRSHVLVSAGTFREVVTLDSGVSIYGGYDKGTWEHDADQYETRIEAPDADEHDDTMHFRTIIADGLDEPTTLDGLTIEGFNAQSDGPDGSSTYVVWARNSDPLLLNNSVLRAGDAARGIDGGDGVNGDTLTCNADGGKGGDENDAAIVCDATGEDGAVGSAGSSTANGGGRGLGGANDCRTFAYNCTPEDGEDGNPGGDGANGDHGSTGSAEGGLSAGLWAPSNGTDGTAGHNGTGGGGGGAGGDCGEATLSSSTNDAHYRGGSGGDGGDGGCGGEAGGNGSQGGGSFGLLSVNSVMSLTDVTIERASGGDGGDGGDGGFKGEADDSSRTDGDDPGGDAAKGGKGASGGDGGSGGGGAGGCGGPSVGIAYLGEEPSQSDVDFPDAPDSARGSQGGEHGDPNDNTVAPGGCAGTVTSTLGLQSD